MKLIKKVSLIFHLFSVIALLAVFAPAVSVGAAAGAISISPSSGVSGTTVTVNDYSIDSGATGPALYFDSINVTPFGVTIAGGSPTQLTFVVPDSTLPGAHSITIKGKTGGVLAETSFYVPRAELSLSRWSATVGTTIRAACKGFHAGQEVSLEYYILDTPQVMASQAAGETGECSMQFTIPASAVGRHEIQVKNQAGDYAITEIEIMPALSINLPVAAVGDKVDISGTGFTANSEVSAILYGNKVAFGQVSSRGSFDAIFFVPVLKAGTYSIGIQDVENNIRWIDFTVDAKITLNKTVGEVGLKEQVNGIGFETDSLVKILYDDKEITKIMANQTGGFSAIFDIPVSKAGDHNITVTDGFNEKTAVFTVESDPPPVPDTYVPKQDSLVSAKTAFAWGSVYDPSEPVTYTMQISRTQDFQQPIFEKAGLLLSEYTLSEAEALRPSRMYTSYYWRVRATDSASNAGNWSEPVAFQVEPSNALPTWANVILGVVAAILAVIMGLRISKAAKAVGKEAVKK
jgi:hypothetical protein